MRSTLIVALVALAGCGPAPVTSGLVVGAPQALIDCATPPGDALQARLWVSGHPAPCALTVEGSAASGACDVTPGLVRKVTIDWFIDRGGVVILLAQATRDVDLTRATGGVEVAFADADYRTDLCLDMSVDSFAGSPTVEVSNTPRPVCDLDEDGETNVVETCNGTDPLGAL